jgi:hypothetical protein
MSPIAQDGWMFAGSALFAFVFWSTSDLSAHRDWGRDAIPGYLVCAAAAAVLCVRRPRRELAARTALSVLCLIMVALVPMALMVRGYAEANREVHILPEAAVIERAGRLLAHARDPYVAEVVDGKLHGQVRGVPRYEAFFPYFPAMAFFGLPSSIHALGDFGDARLYMAAFTLLLLAAGLWLARAPPRRSLRAFQVLCVLPTGAVFLAGGGDDIPVLAISLLGAVAIHRRHNVLGASAFGVAMAMKLTAWPLALLCLLVVHRRDGSTATRKAVLVLGAIVVAVLVPFAVWQPHTFFENTIAFPLGLSGVNSPAASPLPGHVLVTFVPSAEHVLLIALAIAGAPVLAWWLRRHGPDDVAGACRLTAVVAIIVMCVAPATRVGYVVYPVNLLVWSWFLTREHRLDEPDAHDMDLNPVTRG